MNGSWASHVYTTEMICVCVEKAGFGGHAGHERVWDRNYVFCYIVMEIYVIGYTSISSLSFCIKPYHSPSTNLTQSKYESMCGW
jgi:hypothetical protein